MSIEYTYEIIAVNAEARCMEVVYRADGHPTQHIGTRLPYEGEPLESVVAMYAPIRHWEELQAPVVIPQVGVTGTITPQAPVEATPTLPAPVLDEQVIYHNLTDFDA